MAKMARWINIYDRPGTGLYVGCLTHRQKSADNHADACRDKRIARLRIVFEPGQMDGGEDQDASPCDDADVVPIMVDAADKEAHRLARQWMDDPDAVDPPKTADVKRAVTQAQIRALRAAGFDIVKVKP